MSQGSQQGRKEWQVIYDGQCSLCRTSQRILAKRVGKLPVHFVDGNQLGLSPEEFRHLRLMTPEGQELRGFRAVITLWAQSSPWPGLWRVLLWPPFSWLGAALYGLVARHRRAFSKRSKSL
jgi:predicted DCC family thiol-disulfide oxidoreductase YuxK